MLLDEQVEALEGAAKNTRTDRDATVAVTRGGVRVSLTGQLKDTRSPLRVWFEQSLPALKAAQAEVRRTRPSAAPLAPTSSAGYPWGEVGTALDHRAGLALSAPDLDLAARGGVAVTAMVEFEHGVEAGARTAAAIEDFFDGHRRRCLAAGLPAGRPSVADERELARDGYVVALLETACRIGADPRSSLVTAAGALTAETMRQLAADVAVDDLVALAEVVHEVLVPAVEGRTPLHLGPEFAGSAAVGGGADADVIAGGRLLEIKTSVAASLRRQWYYQLIGYALLDFDDEFAIDEVGFFLPRQRQLVVWPLEELVVQASGSTFRHVSELREALRKFLAERDVVAAWLGPPEM